MAKEVLMPKLSSTMSEGHVTEWFKNEGDTVSVGDVIFEVMTDKIAIEVEAYDEGILLKRYVDVGEVVPVNTVIAHIGETGEDVSQPTMEVEIKEKYDKSQEKSEVLEESVEQKEGQNLSNEVRATPAARKLVREHGFDLNNVFNTLKPNVRLHVADVEEFIKKQKKNIQNSSKTTLQEKIIPWKGIRKMVADQMSKSVSVAPQVTLNAKVNVDRLIEMRSEFNELLQKTENMKLTYTHLISYFATKALLKHPLLNAHALEDGVHLKDTVNLGVATALENGLIVPVVKAAERLNIIDLAKNISKVVADVKNNTLDPSVLSGGTFTITSLGSTAVVDFNPILNIPEVAILGVGKIEKSVAVNKVNEIYTTNVITLSLTFDHRAVDGYPAALYLTELVSLIEKPERLILF